MSPTEPGWDEGTEPLAAAAASPAPARPDKEEQRRHLRLVENQAKRRAGRRRLLVILGIASAAVVCLALVALHVLIAENQFRLDRLQQQAATEQASYEKLRLQVAQLEAPARIVSQAEGQLGMVQPASVNYLPATTTPAARTTGKGAKGAATATGSSPQAQDVQSVDPAAAGAVAAPPGGSDWPSVKPYLSGSP